MLYFGMPGPRAGYTLGFVPNTTPPALCKAFLKKQDGTCEANSLIWQRRATSPKLPVYSPCEALAKSSHLVAWR